MWGYNFCDNWLYAAIAVWFFDRTIRFLRILKNGMLFAEIIEVGENYVRIDVPGVQWTAKPGHVGYIGFPTLHPLRPWENHPFSMNSSTLFETYRHALAQPSSKNSASDSSRAEEKSADDKSPETRFVRHVAKSETTTGLSLIIKRKTGMTKMLNRKARLLTILDGPYPHSASTDVLESDHLLLIGGDVGITGILGWISSHPNVKLAWSVKASDQP